MPEKTQTKLTTKTHEEEERHEDESEISETIDEEEEDEEEEDDEEEDDERVPIDLSQNEIYRGICTLFEDEDGNNLLEYISLLHTELIGINKSLENLRLIRKEMTRIADCAEIMLKGKKSEEPTEHKRKTEATVTPTETSVRKKK